MFHISYIGCKSPLGEMSFTSSDWYLECWECPTFLFSRCCHLSRDVIMTHRQRTDFAPPHSGFCSRLFFTGKLSKMDMDGVTVPRGFCLTMKFFESLIDDELRSLLRELEETSIRKSCERSRLEATCDNVRRKINRKRLIFFKNIH